MRMKHDKLFLLLYELKNTADKDVSWIWSTKALVYRNMQVATVKTDCTRLRQDN